METIFFKPHVGASYGTSRSLFDKKILVVGNSHYCKHGCTHCGDSPLEDDCHTFTTDMVNEYLYATERKAWMSTYTKFINTFYPHGAASLEQKENLLDSIVLYNYLQVAAGDNPYVTSHYDFHAEKHSKAFLEVLHQTCPDIVISWGSTVWDAIPNNWGFGDARKIKAPDFPAHFEYPYGGTQISLIGTYHPSSSSYDQLGYREFFKPLIQTKGEQDAPSNGG